MSHILQRTASSITFKIPTVFDKLSPLYRELSEAEKNFKANKNADTSKKAKEAADRYNNVRIALIDSDPSGMAEVIWEEYHSCRNKIDKRALKDQYNMLAAKINASAKHKILLLIH